MDELTALITKTMKDTWPDIGVTIWDPVEARQIVKDVEIAQDITQDTFISVCKRYDHLSNPRAYTRMALVNKCKSYIRSRIFERQKLEKLSNSTEVEQNPDNDFLDVLDILKPKQKTAVILRYYLGFSDKEIAKVINCRAASVSSLIIRSLDTIKKKVDLGIEEISEQEY